MIKLLRRFALAGVSLLAMTVHASAEPVSIGLLLWAGPLGAIFSAQSLISFVSLLPTIIGVGLSVGTAVFSQQRGQTIQPSALKSTFETAEGSEIRAVGRVRVGGLKLYGNTAGMIRYRLIAHTKGPIDAVEEHYLGGRSVTVESNGAVSSPPWSKPGDSWVYVLSKIGDGTETSWTQLMSAFPGIWTAAHRARGIAQSLVMYGSPGVTTDLFGKLYQGGEPAYDRVQRAELVYDPRQDSLNGGSGSQRVDTPSTHTWTDNGILCAVHIMRSYPDLSSDDFDWPDIIDQANRADGIVATKTGTERRARCWGFWQSESKRGDTMSELLQSIGAEVTQNAAGKIRIRLIDDIRHPSVTFTDRHITEFTWKSGPDAVERPNLVRLTYYSPERNYEMADIDLSGCAWARDQLEIDRYGEKPIDIALPFCPSASQAQRIARRLFAIARADTGIIKTNMSGLLAWDQQVVGIEYPDLNETATCLIAPPRIYDAEGYVDIPFVEQPALAAWNPAVDEADAPDEIPELSYDAVMPQPEVVRALIVQFSDGSTKEIRVDYTPLPVGTAITEASYRLYTGGAVGPWSSMQEASITGLDYAYAIGVGAEDQEADFRVRVFNSDDEGSYWGPDDDGEHITLEYDNTTPEEPDVGLGGDQVTGHELHVAYVKARIRFRYTPAAYGPWIDADTKDIRPGHVVSITYPAASPPLEAGDFFEREIIAYTSDATAGPAWTEETEIPAP